jgi:ATP-dependent exoDNAse (exonuclease V) alpha subunit
MDLSKGQQQFFDAALAGENIFLTGKAGTGKSHVVKELMKWLRSLNKNVVAVAPTGIAATNVGGQTIHSLFSINPYGIMNYDSCNFVRQEKRRLLEKIDTILIDEVSMLRPDILDAIHWTFLKNGLKGLQTKQIIFIGDLKQLPPVLKDNDKSVMLQTYDGYSFGHAKIWQKLNVRTIELEEVLRQTDEEFIHHLNIIREGNKSAYFKQFVSDNPSGVILCPHNSTVDEYNKKGLDAIKGELFTFDAQITGNAKYEDFNLPSKIEVKIGAKIMYLVNSSDAPLVNGTIGIFVAHSGCYYIRVGNVDHALEQVTQEKRQYVLNENTDRLELKEIGSITQYPFKLAFALSIHKSQGLTFEEMTLDLSRPCFQPEQIYVALSRVKSPKGLKIKL